MNLLYYAQKYVNQLRWSVIPIEKKLKTPAINWKEYQERFATPEELVKWFSTPLNNLGIVTGKLSNLTVIDVDNMKADLVLKEKNISSPISVRTGRGIHYYFQYNPNVNTTAKIIEGVDIRSEGGQVVAPPSIHESGVLYRWERQIYNTSQLPHLQDDRLRTSEIKNEYNKTGWISEALKGLTNGNRNQTFTKIVGNLHDGRRSMDDIFTILRPYCQLSNFSEGELLNVIRSVTQYSRTTEPSGYGEGSTIYTPGNTEHLAEYRKRIEYKSSFQGRPELATGFQRLDNLLFGLRRGEVYTVGARTGIGKTTFCLNVTSNLLAKGHRCLYLSTEMSFDTIWDRLRSIRGNNVHSDDLGEFQRVKFFVSDIGNPNKERIRQMIQEVRPDVLVFDHIQHLGDSITNRTQELSNMVKALKNMSRELNIAVIVASQLNRGADSVSLKTGEHIKPQLYHLKECSTIEEESTAVILFNKEYQIDDTHDMYLMNVAKNRYGLTGQIEVKFDKTNTRMVEA